MQGIIQSFKSTRRRTTSTKNDAIINSTKRDDDAKHSTDDDATKYSTNDAVNPRELKQVVQVIDEISSTHGNEEEEASEDGQRSRPL